jgi:hypothetical protein
VIPEIDYPAAKAAGTSVIPEIIRQLKQPVHPRFLKLSGS